MEENSTETISDIISAKVESDGRIWLDTKEHTYVWNGEAFDQVD